MYVSSPATIRLVTNHSSSSRGSRYVNVMCAFPSPALKRRHNSRPPVNPPTRRFGSARVGLDRLSRHILPSGWGWEEWNLGAHVGWLLVHSNLSWWNQWSGRTGSWLRMNRLMPRSHQTFRSFLAVKLLGIMLRNRWCLTITSEDADGWCRNCPVWSAPEFEKEPVEVQDCRRIIDRFQGIYRKYPDWIKENRMMWTRNREDLQTLGSRPVIVPKNLRDHWITLIMWFMLSI